MVPCIVFDIPNATLEQFSSINFVRQYLTIRPAAKLPPLTKNCGYFVLILLIPSSFQGLIIELNLANSGWAAINDERCCSKTISSSLLNSICAYPSCYALLPELFNVSVELNVIFFWVPINLLRLPKCHRRKVSPRIKVTLLIGCQNYLLFLFLLHM